MFINGLAAAKLKLQSPKKRSNSIIWSTCALREDLADTIVTDRLKSNLQTQYLGEVTALYHALLLPPAFNRICLCSDGSYCLVTI